MAHLLAFLSISVYYVRFQNTSHYVKFYIFRKNAQNNKITPSLLPDSLWISNSLYSVFHRRGAPMCAPVQTGSTWIVGDADLSVPVQELPNWYTLGNLCSWRTEVSAPYGVVRTYAGAHTGAPLRTGTNRAINRNLKSSLIAA